ncbi:cytochrome P450 2U1-like [Amphiura filiformis]|uniref:cytochrome P450 2U1-like n=1 Tax=Amphiura filiformis TaxID=82378 RepID=UPI003B22263D
MLSFDLSTILLACILFLSLHYLFRDYLWKSDRNFNLPPGPTGWPILGNLPSLDPVAPYLSLNKFAEKYGSVFSLRFGSYPVVILNSYKAVKEAYIRHGDDYNDRPKLVLIEMATKGKGILFAYSDEVQRTRRRFALQAMRNLGMGKFRLEEQIAEEINRLVARFESLREKQFCPFADLDKAFCNVICHVAFGKRYDYDDPKVRRMLINLERGFIFRIASFSGLVNFLPILKHLPFGVMKEFKEIQKDGKLFMEDLIKDVTTNYVKGDPRNFIDMYYDNRDKLIQDKQDDLAAMLDDEDLRRSVGDLFAAGTETISTTAKWALLYMMIYPDIQGKVQSELDDVVGRNRLPSLKDRLNLPYVEATLMEIQRLACIAPFALPRAATVDTQLFGYDIPKGTLILPNIWGILHDGNLWKNPHDFEPTRFLDENGTVIRREELIPFSAGRRKCLGEQLALMELFLFITHLLHRFRFSLPEGAPAPSLQGVMGSTLAPSYYEMCVTLRPMN